MRIIVLGGTKFIGRFIVDDLVAGGHELLVVHRGETEPAGAQDVPHLHTDRSRLSDHADQLKRFRPDALIDTYAMTEADAESVLQTLPQDLRYVVLSSMDVYRAFGAVLQDTETDALPIYETSPVRTEFYPHKNSKVPNADQYEKLLVERLYAQRKATILRLPMVYGPFDPRKREDYVLRRIRAGRKQIPIGSGSWLWSKGYVKDVARATRLALESDTVSGEILNVCESETSSFGRWTRAILDAANADLELVRVDEAKLPDDLRSMTGTRQQHLLVSGDKARRLLGYPETNPEDALKESVQWHLAHPSQEEFDSSADDLALLSKCD